MNFWTGGNMIVCAIFVCALTLVFLVHACRKANVYIQHFGEGLTKVVAKGMCAPVRLVVMLTIWARRLR